MALGAFLLEVVHRDRDSTTKNATIVDFLTMKAIFVTSNEHKRREAAEILGVELAGAAPEVPEIQALEVSEVAAAKARAACETLGSPPHPVLVEDSGLVVEAWNGLPAAFTKWFMRSVGNEGLLRMLPPDADRSARAVCAVAVAGPSEGVRVFLGEAPGVLATEPRGEGGFGWDPIFVPRGASLTYAQMGREKSADSHRTRAFREVRRWLEG
ncbi:MAG: non-canonical purine NTP pyrophosphatase, RdgB/HAM1 family [Actinomycetota bacterium]|nr:non-canonical purine NTP pyrophosphatase, RdgB/HAM1 family [Actinomycetota bacterium]